VHGCYEELLLLHKKAVEEENNGQPFQYVILVGDLCNKGPYSARVIRHVRNMAKSHGWLAIRGNHDNAALKAALGDSHRRAQPKYAWVTRGEIGAQLQGEDESDDDDIVLSDDDVLWMADLPYTIRIPRQLLQGDDDPAVDTVIVHAGLIPGVELQEQSIQDMITLRQVVRRKVIHDDHDDEKEGTESSCTYTAHDAGSSKEDDISAEESNEPVLWALQWKGPFRVIFGHDARRGLQRYNDDYAVGLDTGAVYGKQLTGIILPSRKLVSVDAVKTHCPITISPSSTTKNGKNNNNNKDDI
jgi:bis(5'-nucleosyl)-tetraphosphatase (symmetrical)